MTTDPLEVINAVADAQEVIEKARLSQIEVALETRIAKLERILSIQPTKEDIQQVADTLAEKNRILAEALAARTKESLAIETAKQKVEGMAILATLAKKDDVQKLNDRIDGFFHGVEVLQKSGRYTIYAIVLIGGIGAGIMFIKAMILGLIGFMGFKQQ